MEAWDKVRKVRRFCSAEADLRLRTDVILECLVKKSNSEAF